MPKPEWDAKTKDPQMKRALTVSGIFHLVIIIVAIVGLPFIKSRDIQTPPMIAVELADISDVPTTDRAPVDAPKPPEEKPEPPKPQPKKPPTPPKVTEAPKVETPPEDELAPPKPDKKPEPKPEKPKEKPPEKKIEKKPEPKPTEDKQTENFDSLLKNLIAEDPQAYETDPNSRKTEAPSPTPAPNAPLADKLAASEMSALVNQLAGCWNVMAGASGAEDLNIDVKIEVNNDRTLISAQVVDQGRYGADPFFRAAADSALRALKNPRCSPLLLPPDKYNVWKSMIIGFNPKDMLI